MIATDRHATMSFLLWVFPWVFVWVLLCFVPGMALAQTHPSPPVSGIGDPTCIATMGGSCVLRAQRRSFELVIDSEGVLSVVFKAADSSASSLVISIQDDLLERVESGEMTGDEATSVASELSGYEGVSYTVPGISILKKDLGFPEEAAFDAEDMQALLRTHLQVTLGIGPVTSAYLTDRLGVASLVADQLAVVDSTQLAARDSQSEAAAPTETSAGAHEDSPPTENPNQPPNQN
jgi:hypothetical protein